MWDFSREVEKVLFQIETSQVIVMIEWLPIARGYSRYLVLRYSQKVVEFDVRFQMTLIPHQNHIYSSRYHQPMLQFQTNTVKLFKHI